MRIGQFSKICHVTVDTIRHYMDTGLILPVKDGGYYHFDRDCYLDMQIVLELKELGFSLQEIRSFQFYKRLCRLKPMQKEQFYNDLIMNKMNETEKKIIQLKTAHQKLEYKLREINASKTSNQRVIGLPISTMHLLACPLCKSNLSPNSIEIIDNNMITGNLECNSCEESLEIQNGIVITYQKSSLLNSMTDVNYKFLFAEYVKQIPAEYFERIYQGFEWCKSQINFDNMKGKTILELGSGAGIFLRAIYDLIPEDTTYICVDYNNELNIVLKEIIEHDDVKKKLLFISSEFHDIPLKEKSIDYIIDIVGTSNFMFDAKKEHQDNFLLSDLKYLLKDDVTIIGNYLIFEKYAKAHPVIPPDCRHKYTIKYINNQLSELGFEMIASYNSDLLPPAEKYGKYEDFFIEGDKVFAHSLIGKKTPSAI